MKLFNIAILVVLFALAGCRTESELATLTANAPEPTPSQETMETAEPATATAVFIENTPTPRPVDCGYSPVLEDGFCLLNANATLDGEPTRVEHESSIWPEILQDFPPGWDLYNLIETANGYYGEDFYTDYFGILADAGVYHFDIAGRAGYAGFRSMPIVIHNEQCVLIKVVGDSSIQYIEHHGWNHAVGVIVEKQDGTPYSREQGLPVDDTYAFAPAYWLSPGVYWVTGYITAHFATGQPGTDITIDAIAVGRDMDNDHCQDLRTPKL